MKSRVRYILGENNLKESLQYVFRNYLYKYWHMLGTGTCIVCEMCSNFTNVRHRASPPARHMLGTGTWVYEVAAT